MNIMRLFNIFITDPKGYITVTYISYLNRIVALITTVYCRFIMRIMGIQYGKNIKFRGRTMFLRTPNTNIAIGNNVSFNSLSRYNYRGINHRCIIQTGKNGNIIIGDNCGFSGVSIVSSIGVTIGKNVMCGTNVIIGDRNDHEDRYPQFKPEKIIIKDNVWIGMNSVIMKGVTIGDNSIIGANSIVTKDIPANCIAAGNPCKVIKYIEND